MASHSSARFILERDLAFAREQLETVVRTGSLPDSGYVNSSDFALREDTWKEFRDQVAALVRTFQDRARREGIAAQGSNQCQFSDTSSAFLIRRYRNESGGRALSGRCLPVLGVLCLPQVALAEGLPLSMRSRARAEAVSASVQGLDALLVNPAMLSFAPVQVGLVGVSVRSDENSLAGVNEAGKRRSGPAGFEDILRELAGQREFEQGLGLEALGVTLPHVGLGSFFSVDASLRHSPTHARLKVDTQAGVAGGFSLKLASLSVGYSHILLSRAGANSTPNRAQIATIAAAIENDTLSETTVPFREFTQLTLGHAAVHNLGAVWRPFEGNPTGVAVGVRNLGGADFSEDFPIDIRETRAAKARLEDIARDYALTVANPESLEQITDVAIVGGWGESGQPLHLQVEYDVGDIGGRVPHHALSFDAGFRLPDEWARLAVISPKRFADKRSEIDPYIGLLGMSMFGGRRFREFWATGSRVSLHMGLRPAAQKSMSLSLLRLDLENYRMVSIGSRLSERGMRLLLSLTWVGPS